MRSLGGPDVAHIYATYALTVDMCSISIHVQDTWRDYDDDHTSNIPVEWIDYFDQAIDDLSSNLLLWTERVGFGSVVPGGVAEKTLLTVKTLETAPDGGWRRHWPHAQELELADGLHQVAEKSPSY